MKRWLMWVLLRRDPLFCKDCGHSKVAHHDPYHPSKQVSCWYGSRARCRCQNWTPGGRPG